MSLLSKLEIKEIVFKDKPNVSCFVFYHLPAGMGVVIGNYLRQFLMKYTGGIAPLGAEISDKNGPVKVEQSILSGVVETTPYLIINLKKVIMEEKKEKEGVFCLELDVENKAKEEKTITAGDFQKDKDVKIKNPELYLATLAPSGSLKIKLYFQKNWGYHEEDEQEKAYFAEKEDVIVFDTDYSPVKGGMTNFKVKLDPENLDQAAENLTLIVATNGTVKPKKVLQEVLDSSKESFNFISKLLTNNKEEVGKEEVKI